MFCFEKEEDRKGIKLKTTTNKEKIKKGKHEKTVKNLAS
jgi:hypothetical protein